MGLLRSTMGLFRSRAGNNREEAPADLLNDQTRTVTAPPVAARREVQHEARPDPDKPGWGRTIDLGIGKARGDSADGE